MINIRLLSGKLYKSIEIINNNVNYNQMKILFDYHIICNKYYMIVKNDISIYTNLYDIYEMMYIENIILDNELNIIFLPYNKKDVDEIKNINYNGNNNNFINKFDNKLWSDRLFVLMMVNFCGGYLYRFISSSLKEDYQIIHNAALSNNKNNFKFRCLEFIPNKFKENKEFFKYFINIEGTVIYYSSQSLKNDIELAELAIINNPDAFQFISEELRNTKYIIIKCINIISIQNKNNKLLPFISCDKIKNDKDIILSLIKINGSQLEYVLPKFKKDKDIVYAAIKNSPDAYLHSDKSFYKDKNFILLSLSHSYKQFDILEYENFLKNFDEDILDDKDIALAALKKSGLNFKYLSKRLQNDKDVVILSIINCYNTSEYENPWQYNLTELVKYMIDLNNNINLILNNTTLKYDSDILQTIINKKQEHLESVYKTII